MKNQKGITLIALIITIIVMLILAGVAISMAIGDNGIIPRVEEANISTEKGRTIEIIQTGFYYDEKNPGSLKFSETKDAVEKNLIQAGYTNIQFEGTTFPLTVTATGNYGTYTYVIDNKGNVSNKDGNLTEKLEVSYQILDSEKIALKAYINNDGKTNREIFEELMGDISATTFSLNDPEAWKSIGNYISVQIIKDGTIFTETNTEEEAIEYINKKYLNLPTTQSEDDTIASILICAAKIKVNGILYDIQNNGYLIETEDKNNTIEITFGEITSTIEVKIKSEVETYFFGEDGKGRLLLGEGAIYDLTNEVFLPYPEHEDIQIYKDFILIHDYWWDEPELKIRYNGYIYTIGLEVIYKEEPEITLNFKTNKELGFSKYKLDGNEGKYVEYKDNKWIVLDETNDWVELISANTLGKVALGGDDGESARQTYNNAINILTSKCSEITGITVGGDVLEIRNAGGPAVDTTGDDETIELDWEEHNGKASENGFKKADENYKVDLEKMKKIGIAEADNNQAYWLSSREEPNHNGHHGLFFSIRICFGGDLSPGTKSSLLYINNGYIVKDSSEYGIRPVIKIKKELLESKLTTGKGTESNPIKLD